MVYSTLVTLRRKGYQGRSPWLVSAFVFFAAVGSGFAMVTSSKGDCGQNSAERAGPVERFAVASHEHKEYWFEPTAGGTFFRFLVQDRLRASDVLHRDWHWRLISLRIPDEVAARLSAVAASEGGKSALLRRLIADALSASPARIAPLPLGRPQKITVRFRESEMRKLADTARQRGMTRTGWIVALVRSRLGSPVQHSLEELAALRAIVRELNRIGGNINQIARAANTSVLQGRVVEPDLSAIRDARSAIDLALAQLRGALDGNADYWETRR